MHIQNKDRFLGCLKYNILKAKSHSHRCLANMNKNISTNSQVLPNLKHK